MNRMRNLKFLFILIVLSACNSDDVNNNCGLLIDVNVNLTVNLNLPQFNELNFTSGVSYVAGQGNGGIYLIRANNQTILAWDGADPNFTLSDCSIMTLEGTNVQSSCDGGNEFSLFTGGPLGDNPPPCSLKPYRVEPLGNNTYLVTN